MSERAQRCRPRESPRSFIRPRDLDALASLARARFLTTEQLERLHYGGSRRIAQRRLRALLDHGLVAGALQAEHLHRATVFRPTACALELLTDRGLELGSARPTRLPKPGKLRHAIATRDVFVAAVELEQRGAWKLDEVRFDSELAGDPVLRAAKLVPDVLVRTRAKLGVDARVVFVELDLGTEPLSTLITKLERYELLRGAVEYRSAEVLFLVEGDGRRRRLAALAAGRPVRLGALGGAADALVACSCEVTAHPRRAERTTEGAQLRKTARPSGLRKRGV